MRVYLIALFCLFGLTNGASAQPYNYTLEGFDDLVAFPAAAMQAATVQNTYVSATGAWLIFKGYPVTTNDPCLDDGTNRALRFQGGRSAYVISPLLTQGAGVITFNNKRTNKIFTYYTSTDDGVTWSAGTDITSPGTACGTITITINSVVINRVKIGNIQTNDMGIDNLLITSYSINPPLVTTATVSSITAIRATCGGTVTADGGAPVTARGVCWSTTANPTIANSTTNDGTGLGIFTSSLTGLTPSTTYHVRAYATNSSGTGYGGDSVFTTLPPLPTITVTPSTLSFGTVYQGSFSSEQTYTVSGIFLTPAAGNITITAPAGYIISTTSGAGYASSLTIPYTGSTLTNTIIYIRFAPGSNGSFNGTILHSGGGAPTVNLAVTGIGSLLTAAGSLTNMGTDFWTGYGYHSRMSNNDATNGSWMSLYISSKQSAQVRVSLPGIADPSFPRVVNIPANTSVEVTNFPMGDFGNNNNNPTNLPDARLYFTGTTPRGIHIESLNGVPVAVYEHTYGKDAAGAMLLFPTNTWGSTYNVLSLGGKSNSGAPNSFFFVMASEDNTVIEITPSANIIDSSSNSLFNSGTTTNIKYPANIPFQITLNRGQVFNAMGEIISGVGADLTGTLVKSINCDKKIAVWAGNGRTFVNSVGCTVNAGSDNMLQQMFPRVAWGTKYLTTPTKTMEYSVYKICVLDPTTRVWVNNPSHTTPLTGLIGNFYYQIENNSYNLIESDKPVMLIQYVITGGCKNNTFGNNGNGDPEMIILSPVQQAINNTSVFSAGRMNIANNGASYINVVIKTGGVPSFRLDPATNTTQLVDTGTSSYGTTSVYGSSTLIPIANAFRVHPNEPGYSYARFRVASSQYHYLVSDTGFNAIAYGMTAGESYGYNAGTAIKNLSAIVQTINPYDSVAGTKTCKGNPVTLQIAVPYLSSQITSITWDATTNSNITPNGSFPVFNPVPIRTYVENDITYSVFTSPTPIVFSATGVFRLTATIAGTFSSECGNSQVVPIDMVVIADTPRFNIVTSGCSSTLVTLTDTSGAYAGNNIIKWLWDFGDATTSNVQNPPQHNYPSIAVYNASLRIINNIGCFSDTTRVIDLTGGILAKFGVSPNDTICSSTTVTFSDTSSSTGAYGPLSAWHWDFGEGAPVVATTNANQTHTYNTLGTYFVTLQVKTTNGCLSNIFRDTIVVNATPSVSATASLNTCLLDSVQFTGNIVYPGTVSEYHWDFDDFSSGVNNTSLLQNPKHLFATSGLHNVKFYVVAPGGCTSNVYNLPVTIQPQPFASYIVSSPVCAKKAVRFSDLSVPNSGNLIEWRWDFGDGNTQTNFNSTPFTHQYAVAGSYNVKLTVKTNNGCYDDTTIAITVNATPDVKFDLPGNLCLPNASATFTNNTTISDGTIATVTYLWNFGDPSSGALNISTATSPTHIYTTTGTFPVRLTATSALGCSHDTTINFSTIYAAPLAIFTPPAQVCMNDSIQFTDQSTPVGSISTWSWDFGDGGASGTSTLQNPKHRWNTAGSFTVTLTVTSNAGCPSVTTAQSSQIITVNTAPTISLGTAVGTTTQSLCLGTAITNIDYNLGGSATSATVTGLPPGVTGVYNAGVFTISGSPTAGGIYNYTVTSVSPCTNVSLGGTITVQTLPTITLSSTTPLSCQV
jgi:PKD repeat protein